MAGKDGNTNARKGPEKLIGLISARCQPGEEDMIEEAAAKLGLGKSTLIREVCVRLARDVTERGVVPEWAEHARRNSG